MLMKWHTGIIWGVVAGMAIGAVTVEGLKAQATPPVYYVAEIDVSNPEAYANEYLPKAQAILKAAGARYLATAGPGSSAQVTGFDGEPPKSRVIILEWESLEKIQAWHSSPEYRENRKIGDQYAKFRGFAIPGLAQ
jgi:uncharacterized protein (DUF1330 family)